MSEMADMECRRRSWMAAAAGGVVVAALLWLIAYFPLGTAIFFGLMFFVLFGGFVVWAFCTGQGQDMARTERLPERALQPIRAEPRPVAAPTPRPEPARAAEPAPQPAAPAMAPAAAAAPAAVAATDAVRTAPAPAATPKAGKSARAPRAARTGQPAATTKAEKPARAAKADKPSPAPKAARPAPAAAKPVRAAKAAPAAAAPAKATAKAPTRKAKVAPDAAAARPARATGIDAAMNKSRDSAPAGAGPTLLTQPRGGKGDDLKLIIGIGPKLEKLLNEVGVWHFDQIAAWKAKDIAFVDDRMVGFHGRISRDEWVKQAKILAKGGSVADVEKALGKG